MITGVRPVLTAHRVRLSDSEKNEKKNLTGQRIPGNLINPTAGREGNNSGYRLQCYCIKFNKIISIDYCLAAYPRYRCVKLLGPRVKTAESGARSPGGGGGHQVIPTECAADTYPAAILGPAAQEILSLGRGKPYETRPE